MAAVTDVARCPAARSRRVRTSPARDRSLLLAAGVVLVAGVGLVVGARAGATPLLVAVAVVQAVLAPAWMLGTSMPGRWGGVVLAGLTAAGADVAVSVRPEGRLGVLLPVLGLALSAMFVHQLIRGAARVQVVSSLSGIAVLLVAQVGAAALVQVRHEFAAGAGSAAGGRVAAAVAAAVAAGVLVSLLVDSVAPVPRLDPQVPRGMLALVAAIAAGAGAAVLLLGRHAAIDGARAAVLGAGLGALAGLLAVRVGFVLHGTAASSRGGAGWRAAVAGLLPLTVLLPVGFLLALDRPPLTVRR